MLMQQIKPGFKNHCSVSLYVPQKVYSKKTKKRGVSHLDLVCILICQLYGKVYSSSGNKTAVNFIGEKNRRKPPTCRKSLTNFII
jgi:hypothetical protein